MTTRPSVPERRFWIPVQDTVRHNISVFRACRISCLALWIAILMVTIVALTQGFGAEAPFNERFRVRRWTTEDGLPQNSVICILQSRDGYLWMGTADGVARFDGIQFRTFKEELRAVRVRDQYTHNVLQDGEGTIWFQTRDAIVFMRDGKFTRLDWDNVPGRFPVLNIIADPRAGVWLGGVGQLARVRDGRIVARAATADGSSLGTVHWIEPWDDERAVVTTTQGHGSTAVPRFLMLHFHTGLLSPFEGAVGPIPAGLTRLRRDFAGGLWGLGTNGVHRWRPQSRKFDFVKSTASPAREGKYWGDRFGRLWMYGDTPGTLRILENDSVLDVGPDGFPGINDSRAVVVDREGCVWVGTGKAGLVRLLPARISSFGRQHGISTEVWSIAPRRKGGIWIGTGSGLARLGDGVTGSVSELGAFATGRAAPVFEDKNEELWFGFDNSRIFRVTRGVALLQTFPTPTPFKTISALAEDSRGRKWLAADNQVFMEQNGQWKLRHEFSAPAPTVRAVGLLAAPDGAMWIGSDGLGLTHLDEDSTNRWTKSTGLLDDRSWPLLVEPNGNLWAGTPRGMNRILAGSIRTERGSSDPPRIPAGSVRAVGSEAGLHESHVYYALQDDQRNVWLSSNRGILRVKLSQLHQVADGLTNRLDCVVYGESDGMASSEGNGDFFPGACQTPDGLMWFPTIEGVVRIDPSGQLATEAAPTPVIEQVIVDGDLVWTDGSWHADVRDKLNATADGGQLRLPAGGAGLVEIRFTAPAFSAPEKVRYRWRLVPHSLEFRETDFRERRALYTNLKPGDYTFELFAATHHGIWSPGPARIRFTVEPHLYQTYPFWVCSGLFLLAVAFGFHRARVQWLRVTMEERRNRSLEEQRSRIARDMHDHLGAELTKLKLLGEIAERNPRADPKVRQDIQELSKLAVSVTQNLDEIVWTTDPSKDAVGGLLDYVGHYAEELFRNTPIRCRLDFPMLGSEKSLSAEVRLQLFAVVKELLANVLRHSEASEVWVRFSASPTRLVLRVEDDGRGLDASASERSAGRQTRNGMRNIRSRIEKLGGRVSWERSAGRQTRTGNRGGVSVVVEIPL